MTQELRTATDAGAHLAMLVRSVAARATSPLRARPGSRPEADDPVVRSRTRDHLGRRISQDGVTGRA
ncbi:hypothetical protein [Actinoplanes sp. NPDC049265]|uniref:hypothetical protein n=1 Tax=Actinoplanes sp. NPDC049265 TaxID=3363902 RepID=UPI003711A753